MNWRGEEERKGKKGVNKVKGSKDECKVSRKV